MCSKGSLRGVHSEPQPHPSLSCAPSRRWALLPMLWEGSGRAGWQPGSVSWQISPGFGWRRWRWVGGHSPGAHRQEHRHAGPYAAYGDKCDHTCRCAGTWAGARVPCLCGAWAVWLEVSACVCVSLFAVACVAQALVSMHEWTLVSTCQCVSVSMCQCGHMSVCTHGQRVPV